MPSEYQKWVARNEKPVEKKVLTPAEKCINWLDYHKWYIVVALAVLICIVSLILSIQSNKRCAPDLQIAYIGTTQLPDDTVKALEQALSQYATDITGDGEAKVSLKQHLIERDGMAIMKLAADLEAGESRFFLIEDPQAFQDTYCVLGYSDGVFGDAASREEPLWYQWSDCPELASLELGTYDFKFGDVDLNLPEQSGNNQDLLSKLYIGRRGIDDFYKHAEMDNSMWEKITSGAK